MKRMTKLLLCGLLILGGCSSAQLNTYRESVTIRIDCDEYDSGTYTVKAKVRGPDGLDTGGFILICP
jgi:uncharacterized lipoprotein YmbA